MAGANDVSFPDAQVNANATASQLRKSFLERGIAFFDLPLTLRSRIAILLAVAVLIPVYFFPLWTMTFTSNQYIQSSPNNLIRHNRVLNLRYGLHYMNSDGNKFEDNLFSHNVAGVAIIYSSGIEFRRNAFLHNRGFSSFGILFQDCDACLAEDNFIVDNATGIFMEALRKSTFRRNVIAENDVALQIFSSVDQNLFYGNHFVENLSPLRVIGKTTNTCWQHPSSLSASPQSTVEQADMT